MVMTALDCISHDEPLMDGTEEFPIHGSLLTSAESMLIRKNMKGFRRHWHCLEKAQRVVSLLGRGVVVIGSLHVISGDGKSTYGYNFNPPYEFHAWVQLNDGIIDVALPGVIDRGLSACDDYGPYLVQRTPIILAGTPLYWTYYKPHEIIY
jgi:hypothetical protein